MVRGLGSGVGGGTRIIENPWDSTDLYYLVLLCPKSITERRAKPTKITELQKTDNCEKHEAQYELYTRIIENLQNSIDLHGVGGGVGGAAAGTKIIEKSKKSIDLHGLGSGSGGRAGTRIIENQLNSMNLHCVGSGIGGRLAP